MTSSITAAPAPTREENRAALVGYLGSQTAMGKVGQPRDIAAGILYLVSDAGRYVTGAELVIDGGYTAR